MINAGASYKFWTDDFRKKYKKAVELIRSLDISKMETGRYDYEDGIYYMIQRYETNDPSGMKYEMHKKYADIQYICSGSEMILGSSDDLKEEIKFDVQKDIGKYSDGKIDSIVYLSRGQYALYMPFEYHKPSLHPDGKTPSYVEKIVVKIPV